MILRWTGILFNLGSFVFFAWLEYANAQNSAQKHTVLVSLLALFVVGSAICYLLVAFDRSCPAQAQSGEVSVPPIIVYGNRKELNAATGGLQRELDGLRDGWIMWPAGGTAVSIPLETWSHTRRLILLNPNSAIAEYSRLFVGNEANVKSSILDLTKRAQESHVSVRWSAHSCLSIIINDYSSDSASARIELLLPGVESAFRPSLIIKKANTPRLFQKLVEMYECVWKESENPMGLAGNPRATPAQNTAT